jgi:hypothetical protein
LAASSGSKPDWNEPDATLSKRALITQTPREFDFPNPSLPDHFYYAGPFKEERGREPIHFPWASISLELLRESLITRLVNLYQQPH